MKMTSSEVFLATEFSKKIVGNIDNKDFMDHRNKRRTNKKVLEDNIKGKLAEMFICNGLGENGIKSVMDFEIYDEGVGDDFDIICDEFKIDVKASSPKAKCIMVEENKMKSWESRGKPDYLLMVSTYNSGSNWYCEYVCGISMEEFLVKGKLLQRGENIPKTTFPLKANNWVIHKSDCYDTDNLIKTIRSNNGIQ
jgi:hypothetical protein